MIFVWCLFVSFALRCTQARAEETPRPEDAAAKTAQRPSGEYLAPRHLRPSTPEEKRQWEEAVDALWNTDLGKLYGEYLFSPSPDHADLPLWARLLSERIFREPNLLSLRMSALHIMATDLYVREKMTIDVGDRVMILTQHLEQKQVQYDENLKARTPYVFVPLIIAAVPFGSRAFRQEFRKLKDFGWARLRGRSVRSARRPRPMRAWTNFGDEYDLGYAATALGVEQWMVEGAQYLKNDWLYSSSWAPKDRYLLSGLDALVRAIERPSDLTLARRAKLLRQASSIDESGSDGATRHGAPRP